MAENDFLSGLLGGVKDVGGSIYGGITGLLGGGSRRLRVERRCRTAFLCCHRRISAG